LLDRVPEKKAQISSFIKIRPVVVELFHADGHDEAFRNFANAPKNGRVLNNLFDATQFKVVCVRVV
jgi:hypothetical protein